MPSLTEILKDPNYVNANDVNYRALSASNISYRKTVVFGQNSITAGGYYPLLNAGTGLNYNPPLINAPKIDVDDTTVIGSGVFERTGLVVNAGLNIVVYSDTANVGCTVYGIETSTT
jgi:hypothetical protein